MKQWKIIVIVVVVMFIVLVASIMYIKVNQQPSIIVIPAGTMLLLNSREYTERAITAPDHANVHLTGSYTSNSIIDVAVMTPDQYHAFVQQGLLVFTNAYWYLEYNSGATINIGLVPGESYFIVFYDFFSATTDTITIINSITITYS